MHFHEKVMKDKRLLLKQQIPRSTTPCKRQHRNLSQVKSLVGYEFKRVR